MRAGLAGNVLRRTRSRKYQNPDRGSTLGPAPQEQREVRSTMELARTDIGGAWLTAD
jgi:hypothetical protein